MLIVKVKKDIPGPLTYFTSKILTFNTLYGSGYKYTKKWFKQLLKQPIIKEQFKNGGIPCVNGYDNLYKEEVPGLTTAEVSAVCKGLWYKKNCVYGTFCVLNTQAGRNLQKWLVVEHVLNPKEPLDCMRFSGDADDWENLEKGYTLTGIYYRVRADYMQAYTSLDWYETLKEGNKTLLKDAAYKQEREARGNKTADQEYAIAIGQKAIDDLHKPMNTEVPTTPEKDENDEVLADFWKSVEGTMTDDMPPELLEEDATKSKMDQKTMEANWEITSKAYCEQVNRQVEEAEGDEKYDANKVLEDFWTDTTTTTKILREKDNERSDFE